jgi:hypothetical protein
MKPKKALIGIGMLLALAFMMPMDGLAQGRKGSEGPPNWAPAHGYRAKTRHIYFPDDNFYFDLEKSLYIYLSDNQWEVSMKLPSLFANVDLQGAVQVELDFSGDTPQKYNGEHKTKYKAKSKGRQGNGTKKGGKKKGG